MAWRRPRVRAPLAPLTESPVLERIRRLRGFEFGRVGGSLGGSEARLPITTIDDAGAPRPLDPSKCGQYLDVISVAHGEDARVERDQAHPAATGKCQ
jgi:hypothetical protein